nr:methyl-accepting chemotaxis protein [uncultured Undibacterium sp.]
MLMFFAPAISGMRRLRLLPKFMMVACLFAIPAIVASGLFIWELNKSITLTKSEQRGVQQVRVIHQLTQLSQQHRAQRHLGLSGNVDAISNASKLSAQIEQTFSQLAQLNLQHPGLNTQEDLQQALASWKNIQEKAAASKAKDSYLMHQQLLEQLDKLAIKVADNTNLSLDPQVDTYYLISLFNKSLPEFAAVIADTSARGAPYIDTGLMEPNEDVLINANVMLSQRDLPKIGAQLKAVMLANPELKELEQQSGKLLAENLTFLERTKNEILSTLNQSSGTAYLAAGQKVVTDWFQLNNTIADLIESKLQRRLESNVWNRNAMLLGILILLGLASYLLAGFYLAFSGELRNLSQAVMRVSDGDLSTTISSSANDEIAQLLKEFDAMRQGLARLVANIRESSDNIGSASRDIANGNADLSQRTEQQASSLEETSSSMEELTATVKQNAHSAQQANQKALSCTDVANQGGQAVEQLADMMEGIQQSSKQINDIIAVIDSIAFQTNILALNAAVEAARAGEQGRGFAVVASEVRNLAQRSASAAKEIKILITNSNEQVRTGHQQVQNAGKTMHQIVEQIQALSQDVQAIADASAEQGDGITMVNATISQLDEITQQNTALVEEAAAAAESMHNQALKLSEAVTVFRVDEQVISADKHQLLSKVDAPNTHRQSQGRKSTAKLTNRSSLSIAKGA